MGNPSNTLPLRFLALYLVSPYIIGFLITQKSDVLSAWLHHQPSLASADKRAQTNRKLESLPIFTPEDCYQTLLNRLSPEGGGKPEVSFHNLSLVIHRNGEAKPCGEVSSDSIFSGGFKSLIESLEACPDWDNKYVVESFLTRFLHSMVASTCSSLESDRSPLTGFYGFCDMGEGRTPVLLDHQKLVPNVLNNTTFLPCHFHNHNGIRISSFSALSAYALEAMSPEFNCKSELGKEEEEKEEENCLDAHNEENNRRELHLYAVPAGRVFMFAPTYVGQIIDLPHVQGADPTKPVYLEVMSLEPRVFDLINFFTRDESATLIGDALKETREDFRIKRSSTGNTGYNLNPRRTSESGFDTSSETSVALKRKCFHVLGFDEYIESHADGLQLLRYNLTTSYISHMDYLDIDDTLPHDYDSAHKGGNRFATILLYMTDLGEKDGGETVFTHAWPVGQAEEDHVHFETALEQLRASGEASMLVKDSWQEHMVARCRTRLAVRPYAGRAVLFYSQHPNGTADKASLHGGCPVLAGTKYAANLWVWNTPRAGFHGHPKNPKAKDSPVDDNGFVKKTARFINTGKNPAFKDAELYFEDQFWARLGHYDEEMHVNTYDGHVWNLKVAGSTVKTWTIGGEETAFVFEI